MLLIIDKSKASARKLADTLYYFGLPTLAATPREACSKLNFEFSAIILLSPSGLADIPDFVSHIRSAAISTPIFALSDKPSFFEYSAYFDGVYKSGYVSELIDNIREYCKSHSLKIPGNFRIAGLDASITLPECTYLWRDISLTKTEKMILRVFIATYPRPLSARDVLNLAFKKSKVPEPSNVRAHLSIMNKKFREIIGHNLFGFSTFESAYRILTPEVLENKLYSFL